MVNSVLDLAKNLIGFIAKYAVGANLFRLGSSILKDAGSRGADPMGVVGAKPPSKKIRIKSFCKSDDIFFLQKC